jgi:hypothetical protein
VRFFWWGGDDQAREAVEIMAQKKRRSPLIKGRIVVGKISLKIGEEMKLRAERIVEIP